MDGQGMHSDAPIHVLASGIRPRVMYTVMQSLSGSVRDGM